MQPTGHPTGHPAGLSTRQLRERAGLSDLARLLDLTTAQLDRLRPAITLYLHTSRASLEGTDPGAARGEDGLGPLTRGQLCDLLGHGRITVKEVIDLADQPAVDAYETPRRLREALRLTSPATAFPHSPLATARTDVDHTTPYLPPSRGGPPGQTRLDNLGLLGRTAHRIKTHAPGWLHLQPRPGTHLWRTPHGYWYRVDPHGTHPLGTRPATTADDAAARPTPDLRHHADLIHGPVLDWEAA